MKNAVLSKMNYWLLLVLMALPMGVYGDDIEIEGVIYAIQTDDATAIVTGTNNKQITTANIRETVDDGTKEYKVVGIGENAFNNCRQLTGVVIGDNLTTIGKQAFIGTAALFSVQMGKSVQTIGEYAFQNSGIESIDIPHTVTSMGKLAFSGCSKLSKVTIGKGLTEISQEAFTMCSELQTITLHQDIASIGVGAFARCNKLSEIYIKRKEPAILKTMAFYELANNFIIYVPSGTVDDYKLAPGWVDYDTHIVAASNTVNINFTSTFAGGTIKGTYDDGGPQPLGNGDNDVPENSRITLEVATLNAGYKFKNYIVANIPTEDDVVIADADKSISALFEKIVVMKKVTLVPLEGGVISGSYVENGVTKNLTKEGDTSVPERTKVTLTQDPNPGYTFISFSANGTPLSGDEVTIDGDKVITATYKKDSPTPPVPPTTWHNIRVPASKGVLFTSMNQEGDSINLDVLDRGSLTFYIKLKPDYIASGLKVTTNRGEVLLPRDSDNKYVVNEVCEDVEVKVEGVHPTGNEAIDADLVKVWTSNGEIHIQAPAQEKVHIVTFAGALLKQLTTTGGHTAIALAPGNYIVRVGQQSFKVNL